MPELRWAPGAVLWVLGFQLALGHQTDAYRLGLLAGLWLVLAGLSGCSAGLLLVRALVVLPFCLAALPMAFSGPGPEISLGHGLALQLPGLQRWLLLVVRAWLGLAATLWLLTWLGRDRLLAGLTSLRVPALLLGTVALMLRYGEVLGDELGRMQRARQARGCGPTAPGWRWRARAAGELAGALMVRSQVRSERVCRAMICRGGLLPPRPATPLRLSTGLFWMLGGLALVGLSLWP